MSLIVYFDKCLLTL